MRSEKLLPAAAIERSSKMARRSFAIVLSWVWVVNSCSNYQVSSTTPSARQMIPRAFIRNKSHHLLRAFDLSEKRWSLAKSLAAAGWIQWDCILPFVAPTHLDFGSPESSQADDIRLCRHGLMHGSAGRYCLQWKHGLGQSSFCDAVPVQLLLRRGLTGHSLASSVRIRSAGYPNSSGSSGFCVQLVIHIPGRANHVRLPPLRSGNMPRR